MFKFNKKSRTETPAPIAPSRGPSWTAAHTLEERDRLTGLLTVRYLRRLYETPPWPAHADPPMVCVRFAPDGREQILEQDGPAALTAITKKAGSILRSLVGDEQAAIRLDQDQFLVILASATLTTGWTWAERVRQRLGQIRHGAVGADAPVPFSAGVVAFTTGELSQTMVELAEAGLDLAQSRGGAQVCSWHWVEMEDIIARVERDPGTVEDHRIAMLQHAEHLFGPSQRFHVHAHCERVSALATQLAEALRQSEEAVEEVRLAGLLHDLGKGMLPEALLSKPSSLSIEEWMLMDRHAQIGAELAARLGAADKVVAIIRHHHTRYDRRTVYTEDERPPLGAHIVAVAEAMVSIVTEQSYDRPRPFTEALQELIAGSGSQFHPDVVAAAQRIHFGETRRAA